MRVLSESRRDYDDCLDRRTIAGHFALGAAGAHFSVGMSASKGSNRQCSTKIKAIRDEQVLALGARGKTKLADWRWFEIPKDGTRVEPFGALFRNIEDWALEDEWEPQTVHDFVHMERWKVSKPRRTIFVEPLSFNSHSDSTSHPSLAYFAEFIETYFGLPVSVLPAVEMQVDKRGKASLESVAIGSSLNEFGERRYDVLHIMDYLFDRIPSSAYALLAVTDLDIFEDEEDPNVIMGRGSGDRVGVVSLYRFNPSLGKKSKKRDSKKRNLAPSKEPIDLESATEGSSENSSPHSRWLLDTCKTLAHETMHMFGLDHCTHFICVMNANVSPLDDGKDPLHLCPVCLRKLHLAIGFTPSARFYELLRFYQRMEWPAEAQFVQQRIASVESMASPSSSSSLNIAYPNQCNL